MTLMNQHRMQTAGLGASAANNGPANRLARIVLTLVIVELSLATAYIHLGLGGELFTVNGVGYLGLATAYAATVAVPIAILQRFAWLARLGLAGYTLVTIGAYLVVGPHFTLGWITKGIEVAIVGLLLVDMLGAYGSVRGLLRAASERTALIATIALAGIVAACGASAAGSNPPIEQTDADVTITSRDVAFDQTTLTIDARTATTLRLVNEDAAPHNVAIYSDDSATESLFIGDLITATSVVYELPELEPGTYYFRCDLHPEMDGTLTAED